MNARTTLVLAVMSLAVLAALLPAPDPAPLLAAAQDIAANLPSAGGLVR